MPRLVKLARHEDCVSTEWWEIVLHLGRCSSDPLHALCMLIGEVGVDYLPYYPIEPKWYLWN